MFVNGLFMYLEWIQSEKDCSIKGMSYKKEEAPYEFTRTLQPTGVFIPDDTGGRDTKTAWDHQQGGRKMPDGSLCEHRDSLQYREIVPDFI